MSIKYDETARLFHLKTKSSSYQMKVDDMGLLLHLYYGEAVTGDILCDLSLCGIYFCNYLF